jgi:uncharacterized protein
MKKIITALCFLLAAYSTTRVMSAMRYVPVNVRDNAALIRASERGRVEEVQRLIGAKVDLNHKDCYGNTALMYAVCRGHTSIVKQLADAGANPNITDAHNRTALMYAAHNGRIKEAQLLVGAKADLTIKDKIGMTAADYANFQCHPAIVALLNTQDKTAVIRASEQGKVAEVQRLIGAKVDLNHKDCYGNTALMYAVCRGHTSIVKQLADAGADPNITDKHKRTALMYAAHNGRLKEARLLVAAKADMNIRDAEGYTALIHAALQKHEDIVRILATADPDAVECGICNEEGGDFAVIAPCHHHYHRHCLDAWKSHDATCPKCRGKIEKYSATIRLPAIAKDEE